MRLVESFIPNVSVRDAWGCEEIAKLCESCADNAFMSHQHVEREKAVSGDELSLQSSGAMPSDEFLNAAEVGEQEAKNETARESAERATPLIFKIGNGGERSAAKQALDRINGYRDNMIQGIKDGLIEPAALSQNLQATELLGDFLVSAGEQGRTLSDFQRSYQGVRLDVARFSSQLELVQKQNPGLQGNLVDAWGGEKELKKSALKVSTEGGGSSHWTAMQTDHSELERYVGEAQAQQHNAVSAQFKVTAALNDIESGVTTRDKGVTEGSEIVGVTEAIKKVLGVVIEKGFEMAELPGAGIAAKIAEAGVDAVFAPQLRVLDAKVAEQAQKQQHGALQAQVSVLRAEIANWAAAKVRCGVAQRQVQNLKANMRDSARQFAGSSENKGEFAVGMIASMYAESEGLLAQIGLAIGLGTAEQSAKTNADADHIAINKPNMVTDLLGLGRGVRYFEPVRTYSRGRLSYDASARNVFIGSDGLGGTDGAKGVNPVVEATLQDLRKMQTVMTTTRDRLAGALGFSKTQDAP